MRYAVIFEKSEASFGAYVPDLPGCVAVGESLADARALIAEAMKRHLGEMKKNGEKTPEPASDRRVYRRLTFGTRCALPPSVGPGTRKTADLGI